MGKLKKTHNISRNSSFVSIRKAPAQSHVTNTNKDEKVQTPILNIEALKTISRIVRAIKTRIDAGSGTTN